jgi:hypothetical protein
MESEHKAKQMLQDAEKKLEAIQHDVQELTRQRHQLMAQIRQVLEQHLRLLETMEDESEDATPEALQ